MPTLPWIPVGSATAPAVVMASRFGLRVFATWVGLVAGLGLTIAATVYFDLSGLPALPAITLGFLLPNADLLWREVRLGRVADE